MSHLILDSIFFLESKSLGYIGHDTRVHIVQYIYMQYGDYWVIKTGIEAYVSKL